MQSKIKKLSLYLNPFLIVLLVYFSLIFAINPFHEFAINDDWDFFIHVKSFLSLEFTKNSLIDSTFILQGLVATLWSFVFGLSFIKLKVLTIAFFILSIFSVYKMMNLYNINKKTTFVYLVTIAFNPILFHSSLTFMTEVYFVTLITWSVYFYLRFTKSEKNKDLVSSLVIGALSILVRQFGVIYCFALLLSALVSKSIDHSKKRGLILGGSVVLICIAISYFWPQVTTGYSSKAAKYFSVIVDITAAAKNIDKLMYVIPYMGFFILPLVRLKSSFKHFWAVIILSCFLGYFFFTHNVFNLGNVLYVEGLYMKNEFPDLSLLNNQLTKLVFSIFFTYGFVKLVAFLKLKLDDQTIISMCSIRHDRFFLFLSAFLLGISTVLTRDMYDRYLISSFTLLVFFLLTFESSEYEKFDLSNVAGLLMLLVISFIHNFDYFNLTSLQWNQAFKLNRDLTKIQLNGTFQRYVAVKDKKDFSSIKSNISQGAKYNCFVQAYSTVSDKKRFSIFMKMTRNLDSRYNLKNPIIDGASKQKGTVDIKSQKEFLTFSERYTSITQTLIGRDAYVGTYCLY